MELIEKIIPGLEDGRVEQILVGTTWTAVVVQQDGRRSCGLASNPVKSTDRQTLEATLSELQQQSAKGLCSLATRHGSPLASVGLAAINALIPPRPESWVERNASEVIADRGQGKRVALVGHFPFVPELRQQVGELQVLELRPQDGDIHASEAPRIIPKAEVVAITSMAFINGTLQGLLDLCSPEAYVAVLGPSTPCSPVLLENGIDLMCGCVVEQIDPVMEAIQNGEHFKHYYRRGARLVTIEKTADGR